MFEGIVLVVQTPDVINIAIFTLGIIHDVSLLRLTANIYPKPAGRIGREYRGRK